MVTVCGAVIGPSTGCGVDPGNRKRPGSSTRAGGNQKEKTHGWSLEGEPARRVAGRGHGPGIGGTGGRCPGRREWLRELLSSEQLLPCARVVWDELRLRQLRDAPDL